MIKSSDWQRTLQSSLWSVQNAPNSIIVMDAIGPRMAAEIASGVPFRDLYDEKMTRTFRLLSSQMLVDPLHAFQTFTQGINAAQVDFAERQRQMLDLHDVTVKSMNTWGNRLLASDARKRLKRRDLTILPEILRSGVVTEMCKSSLQSAGASQSIATALASTDSVSRRNTIAFVAYMLRWYAYGGLQSRTPTQIKNDYVDLDVVVTGTYCSRTRTKDKIVRELDAILRQLFVSS